MFGSLPPHGALDSVVGIATRYELAFSGSNPDGASFSAPLQPDSEAHPASYTLGTWSFPGIKRPERVVYHPPHLAPK